MKNENEAFFDLKLSDVAVKKIIELELSSDIITTNTNNIRKNLAVKNTEGFFRLQKNNFKNFLNIVSNVLDKLIFDNEKHNDSINNNVKSINSKINNQIIEELEEVEIELHLFISMIESKYPEIFEDKSYVFTEKMKEKLINEDKIDLIKKLNKEPKEKEVFFEDLISELKNFDIIILNEESIKEIDIFNNLINDLSNILLDSNNSNKLNEIINFKEEEKINERVKFIESARKNSENVFDINSKVNKKIKSKKLD